MNARVCVAGMSPNVVVLFVDDLGWKDIGCYGGPALTPTLDEMAAKGVRFTDFHAGCAICSPSRAVALTGRHHIRAGVYNAISDMYHNMHLLARETTLAEVLKAHNYATAHFGKWHLGLPYRGKNKPTPDMHGFDYWFATENNANPSHRNPVNFIRNGDRTQMINRRFDNPEAEKLRMQYIKLNQFPEASIPAIKAGGIGRVELYDLSTDIGQQTDTASQHPDIVTRLKKQMDEIYASVMVDAPEWVSTTLPNPDLDSSGSIDFQDFLIFAQSFGKTIGDPAFNATADLDSSGSIDFQDFLIFVQAYNSDNS